MTKSIFIFLGTFAVGALLALVTRAAFHDPHSGHEGHVATAGEHPPMVTNVLAPSAKALESRHAQHTSPAGAVATAEAGKPVNTVCAICGMDVDPRMPTAEYQGQTIGFGCRMCPPKFKADPDRYGPLYLKNEVVKR